MTPRQRRGVLLLFVAAVGAILVFSAISSYVDNVRKDVDPKTTVLVLTRSVPELQQWMLVEPPSLEEGQQEISILINADTGVAGKLEPGDTVDVLATFPADERQHSPASARTLIRRARVVTVGLPRSAAKPGSSNGQDATPTGNEQEVLVPVTFALRPTLALRLTYAETFASEIRLSLIRRGDEGRKLPKGKREFTLPSTIKKLPPVQGAGQ